MQRRCDRNRKRSKRRAIYCPVHGCYLDSVSQKYSLFADTPGQLQERGVGRREAQILVAAKTAIHLQGEWLEAFWCNLCQETTWYRIRKQDNVYVVSIAPTELWQRVAGVNHPKGNPSVSEYTLRHSRTMDFNTINDFKFINQ